MKRLNRAVCWWFGCVPNTERACRYCTPCARCDNTDCDYADLVGDTRHNRAKEWARYWLLFGWTHRFRKCRYCGKRAGAVCDNCLPF